MMQTIAQIKNATHRYKGAAANSLDGVSLTIQRGETLLLCGASGSGKTSVIRLLNGLIVDSFDDESRRRMKIISSYTLSMKEYLVS